MKLEDLRKALREPQPPKPKAQPKPAQPTKANSTAVPLLACPKCKGTSVQVIERDRDILTNVWHLRVKCHDCEWMSAMEVSEEVNATW